MKSTVFLATFALISIIKIINGQQNGFVYNENCETESPKSMQQPVFTYAITKSIRDFWNQNENTAALPNNANEEILMQTNNLPSSVSTQQIQLPPDLQQQPLQVQQYLQLQKPLQLQPSPLQQAQQMQPQKQQLLQKQPDSPLSPLQLQDILQSQSPIQKQPQLQPDPSHRPVQTSQTLQFQKPLLQQTPQSLEIFQQQQALQQHLGLQQYSSQNHLTIPESKPLVDTSLAQLINNNQPNSQIKIKWQTTNPAAMNVENPCNTQNLNIQPLHTSINPVENIAIDKPQEISSLIYGLSQPLAPPTISAASSPLIFSRPSVASQPTNYIKSFQESHVPFTSPYNYILNTPNQNAVENPYNTQNLNIQPLHTSINPIENIATNKPQEFSSVRYGLSQPLAPPTISATSTPLISSRPSVATQPTNYIQSFQESYVPSTAPYNYIPNTPNQNAVENPYNTQNLNIQPLRTSINPVENIANDKPQEISSLRYGLSQLLAPPTISAASTPLIFSRPSVATQPTNYIKSVQESYVPLTAPYNYTPNTPNQGANTKLRYYNQATDSKQNTYINNNFGLHYPEQSQMPVAIQNQPTALVPSQSSVPSSIPNSIVQPPIISPQYGVPASYPGGTIVAPAYARQKSISSNLKSIMPLVIQLLKDKITRCGFNNDCPCECKNDSSDNELEVASGYTSQKDYGLIDRDPLPVLDTVSEEEQGPECLRETKDCEEYKNVSLATSDEILEEEEEGSAEEEVDEDEDS